MRSPFPGMDLYLEAHWGDIHHRLIQYSSDSLQAHLPDDLRARVEERVFVESDTARRHIIPEVHISEVWRAGSRSIEVAGGIAVAEPLVVEVSNPPITEGYIEIRERGGGKIVTVLEFLSPANKLGGAGTQKYLEKQEQVLRSDASLVEVDLVRAGRYRLAAPPGTFPHEMLASYLACISPGWNRTRHELYTMPIRQRLPTVPIPLREGEPRVALDLQALLDHSYLAGRYSDLNYSAELDNPLTAEDAAWASEVIKAAKATWNERRK